MRALIPLCIVSFLGCSGESADPDRPADAALDTTDSTTSPDTASPEDTTVADDTAADATSETTDAADVAITPGASGTIDTTFGEKGVACAVLGSAVATIGTTPVAIVQPSSGDVLLVGHGYGVDIARFHSDGTYDKARSTYGNVVPGPSGDVGDVPWAATLVDGDGVLVAGQHQENVDGGPFVRPLLVRTKADLTPDLSFGGKGYVFPSYGAAEGAIRAIARTSGKFVVAGSLRDAGKSRAFVARHLDDGTLDATFGAGGVTSFAYEGGTDAFGVTMKILPDGRLVVVGRSAKTSTSGEIGVARLSAEGVLDATFGTGGVRHVPIASALGAIAVTPSSSDTFTIAAAGADDYGIYALARFGNAGALVAAFGDAGVVSGLPNVYASRAVLGLADGKLLAGATAILPSDGGYAWRVSLERLDDTGARDPSFGVGGQALVSMDPTPDAPLVADIARQSDGRILVAAKARGGMCVARLWP